MVALRVETRTSPRPPSEPTFHHTLLFWRRRAPGRGPRQPGSGRGTRPRGVGSTRASGPASDRGPENPAGP